MLYIYLRLFPEVAFIHKGEGKWKTSKTTSYWFVGSCRYWTLLDGFNEYTVHMHLKDNGH